MLRNQRRSFVEAKRRRIPRREVTEVAQGVEASDGARIRLRNWRLLAVGTGLDERQEVVVVRIGGCSLDGECLVSGFDERIMSAISIDVEQWYST